MTQYLGTAAAETLTGGAQDDYLNGGGGNDALKGKGGLDAFGLSVGGGHDVVLDFSFSATNDFKHDHVVFDGWGNFVLPRTATALQVGDAFLTDQGHTLSVGADGSGDLVLSWDTGESLTLANIAPGEFHMDWMQSLDSYGYF